MVRVATTSCRMVTWEEEFEEIKKANLKILDHYLDTTISGFVCSMVVELSL